MEEHHDIALPKLEDLIPDPATLDQLMDGVREHMEKVVPQAIHERLGANLPKVPPEPLANSPLAAQNWFDMVAVIAEYEEGVTARQLAKRIGQEPFLKSVRGVLEHLAKRGELRKSTKGTERYHARPMSKVLPHLLRQFSRRLDTERREAFELAVLTYQEAPGAREWRELVEAASALVSGIPGWPEAIADEVEAHPAEWLRLMAGVEPPAYEVREEDPLLAELHDRIRQLELSGEALRERLAEALAELETQRARVAQLEAENSALREDAEAWRATFERPTWEDFLAGRGPGELPEDLSEGEVARLRSLVLATKASRKDQLAIAAGLAAVYRDPTGHQRLTTLSFWDHPYDSLWRARVGNYRIVYGLLRHVPHPIVIGSRGEVYEQAVHALKHRQL